jgi:hypothetical protein
VHRRSIRGALAARPNANAACIVTTTGTVSCNADTITTNIDGANRHSSARKQRFHNGGAIHGTIQSGVTVSGFGLKLIEKAGGKKSQAPIAMNNQSQITTSKEVNALQLSGDGRSTSYSGNGSIMGKKSRAVRRSHTVPTAKRLRSASGQ